MVEEKRIFERVEYLASADGQFRRYVGGEDKESERYKAARHAVQEYEESARGVLSQVVMSMKHERFSADSTYAHILLTSCTECCDSEIYLFNVETGEQFETLVKWMKLQYPSEEIGVAAPEPYYEEIEKVEDGKVVKVKSEYPRFYLRNDTIDPGRFIGHTVVVYHALDYRMYLEGTLEEVKARNEFMKKDFESKILSKLK